MRRVLAGFAMKEECKWGKPTYTVDGKNIARDLCQDLNATGEKDQEFRFWVRSSPQPPWK